MFKNKRLHLAWPPFIHSPFKRWELIPLACQSPKQHLDLRAFVETETGRMLTVVVVAVVDLVPAASPLAAQDSHTTTISSPSPPHSRSRTSDRLQQQEARQDCSKV
jgi:hypothetical protein